MPSRMKIGEAAALFNVTPNTPGRHYALANATIHMHRSVGGIHGQEADIRI